MTRRAPPGTRVPAYGRAVAGFGIQNAGSVARVSRET